MVNASIPNREARGYDNDNDNHIDNEGIVIEDNVIDIDDDNDDDDDDEYNDNEDDGDDCDGEKPIDQHALQYVLVTLG